MAISKNRIAVLLLILLAVLISLAIGLSACKKADDKIAVKVLVLPNFQIGDQADTISGDFPGEGQYYFQKYMKNAEEYEVPGGHEGSELYVKDGIGYYVLGEGKVNAALTTTALLTDERFDFSDAYVLSVGCCGSATETTVMGDVFLITAAVDYDAGHHADIRDMENKDRETWFRDEDFDEGRYVQLDPGLMDKVYALVKDVPLKTTEETRKYMADSFDGAAWAIRDPKVLRGTTVTGDNYWKGEYDQQNALLMTESYGCPDPYVSTEMENLGVAAAMQRLDMLDRLIILRASVNMDVFMGGNTPESLWGPEEEGIKIEDRSDETADVFATSMKNNFLVGKKIIEAILAGKL